MNENFDIEQKVARIASEMVAGQAFYKEIGGKWSVYESDVADKLGFYRRFTGTIDYGQTKATVKGADFGVYAYGHIVFERGTWIDGTWSGGRWEGGTWLNGVWNDGYWYKGTWKNGVWKNGAFGHDETKKSDWMNGTFENGVFETGNWHDGVWKGGKWSNWYQNFWMKGMDGNGVVHGRGECPLKWNEDSNVVIASELVRIARDIVALSKVRISDQDLRRLIAHCYFDSSVAFTSVFDVLNDTGIEQKGYPEIAEKFHELSHQDSNLSEEKHHASVDAVALYLGTGCVKKCRDVLEEKCMSGFGDVSRIKDPKGGKITYRFHTEAGSEYIMSENGMSRRIKSKQGLGDEGLHNWQEHIFFTELDFKDIVNSGWWSMWESKSPHFKHRIAVDNDELCIEYARLKDSADGKHKKMSRMEKATRFFDICDAKNSTIKIERTPRVGLTVIEIESETCVHVGHRVSKIDWKG